MISLLVLIAIAAGSELHLSVGETYEIDLNSLFSIGGSNFQSSDPEFVIQSYTQQVINLAATPTLITAQTNYQGQRAYLWNDGQYVISYTSAGVYQQDIKLVTTGTCQDLVFTGLQQLQVLCVVEKDYELHTITAGVVTVKVIKGNGQDITQASLGWNGQYLFIGSLAYTQEDTPYNTNSIIYVLQDYVIQWTVTTLTFEQYGINTAFSLLNFKVHNNFLIILDAASISIYKINIQEQDLDQRINISIPKKSYYAALCYQVIYQNGKLVDQYAIGWNSQVTVYTAGISNIITLTNPLEQLELSQKYIIIKSNNQITYSDTQYTFTIQGTSQTFTANPIQDIIYVIQANQELIIKLKRTTATIKADIIITPSNTVTFTSGTKTQQQVYRVYAANDKGLYQITPQQSIYVDFFIDTQTVALPNILSGPNVNVDIPNAAVTRYSTKDGTKYAFLATTTNNIYGFVKVSQYQADIQTLDGKPLATIYSDIELSATVLQMQQIVKSNLEFALLQRNGNEIELYSNGLLVNQIDTTDTVIQMILSGDHIITATTQEIKVYSFSTTNLLYTYKIAVDSFFYNGAVSDMLFIKQGAKITFGRLLDIFTIIGTLDLAADAYIAIGASSFQIYSAGLLTEYNYLQLQLSQLNIGVQIQVFADSNGNMITIGVENNIQVYQIGQIARSKLLIIIPNQVQIKQVQNFQNIIILTAESIITLTGIQLQFKNPLEQNFQETKDIKIKYSNQQSTVEIPTTLYQQQRFNNIQVIQAPDIVVDNLIVPLPQLFKGQVYNIDCPQCGGYIKYYPQYSEQSRIFIGNFQQCLAFGQNMACQFKNSISIISAKGKLLKSYPSKDEILNMQSTTYIVATTKFETFLIDSELNLYSPIDAITAEQVIIYKSFYIVKVQNDITFYTITFTGLKFTVKRYANFNQPGKNILQMCYDKQNKVILFVTNELTIYYFTADLEILNPAIGDVSTSIPFTQLLKNSNLYAVNGLYGIALNKHLVVSGDQDYIVALDFDKGHTITNVLVNSDLKKTTMVAEAQGQVFVMRSKFYMFTVTKELVTLVQQATQTNTAVVLENVIFDQSAQCPATSLVGHTIQNNLNVNMYFYNTLKLTFTATNDYESESQSFLVTRNQPKTESDDNTLLWVLLGVGLGILVLGVIGTIVYFKKRKRLSQSSHEIVRLIE